MTTIAYDGTILAADTMIASGDIPLPKPVSKLWTLSINGRKVVVAGAGNPNVLMLLAGLYGQNAEKIRKHHALVPAPALPSDMSGSIIVLDSKTGRAYYIGEDACAVDITGEQWACGSGRRFALGAMAAGASARKAVLIASKYDHDTGSDIQWLEASDLSKIQSWMEVE